MRFYTFKTGSIGRLMIRARSLEEARIIAQKEYPKHIIIFQKIV